MVKEITNFIESKINIIENQNIKPIIHKRIAREPNKNKKLNQEYLWSKLKSIISKEFECSENCINYDSRILSQIAGFFSSSTDDRKYSSDIGLNDDLDRITLIMAIEDEFDIEIPDEQSETIVTVQDLYDVIISCLNN